MASSTTTTGSHSLTLTTPWLLGHDQSAAANACALLDEALAALKADNTSNSNGSTAQEPSSGQLGASRTPCLDASQQQQQAQVVWVAIRAVPAVRTSLSVPSTQQPTKVPWRATAQAYSSGNNTLVCPPAPLPRRPAVALVPLLKAEVGGCLAGAHARPIQF